MKYKGRQWKEQKEVDVMKSKIKEEEISVGMVMVKRNKIQLYHPGS